MDKGFYCGLSGRIVTRGNALYNELRQDWNRAIQQYPLVIVYCMDKQDVCNAIIWSRKHCIPLRIRNGGHNYEGYSNGTCVLVIDLSEMNSIELDECRNLIHVEGGVTNGQIYNFVGTKGYVFPGGTCPTVGLSGYASGGGWGLSCRNFGLGCDSLVEIELVNYQGIVVKANRKLNSDLFWACRGAGGGNFGVIVSMTFRLPPRIEKVTLIEVDYINVDSSEQENFIQVWQEWLKYANNRTTLISRIYNSKEDGLSMLIRGIFYGGPCEAEEIIRPFLELRKAEYNIEYMTFLEAVDIIGQSYPSSEMFGSVSRFVVDELNERKGAEITELIKNSPDGSVFAGLSMYALGGKVSEIRRDSSAFYYRNAKYIIWLQTVWEESQYAQDNRRWISNGLEIIQCSTKGSYVNFPYGKLKDFLEEYYGGHAYALKRIKRKYDPFNVFTFPQGIDNCENKHYYMPESENINLEESKCKSSGRYHREFRYVRDKNKHI